MTGVLAGGVIADSHSEEIYHSTNGPGISGPGGPFMFNIIGPPGPLMPKHKWSYQNINGPPGPINVILQNYRY